MNKKAKRILSVLLAAVMIVFIAAGCSSEEASGAPSDLPESSQAEPSQESKPEPSSEPSNDESSQEESSEESSQGPQELRPEDVLGYWEYNIGNEYLGIKIDEDGAVYHYADGSKIEARWEIEDGKLSIYVAGGRQDLILKDGKLTDTYNGHVYFKGKEPDPGEATFDAIGYWEYSDGDDYLGIVIHDDGTAVYKYASGSDINARWEVEGDTLSIFAAGGRQDLVYEEDKLIDTYNGHVYLRSTLPDRDEPAVVPGEFDPTGLWEYNVGEDYLAIRINSDGSASYVYSDGTEIEARWSIENGKLSVFAAGGRQIFTFSEDCITDTFNDNAYFKAG